MPEYVLYGWFSEQTLGKEGLFPTVDIRDRVGNLVLADEPAAEIGGGLYCVTFTSTLTKDFLGVFKTSDMGVDAKHFPALYPAQLSEVTGLADEVYSRLVTVPAVNLAIPSESAVSAQAGDTVNFQITGLGNLMNAVKIYLTVKQRKTDPDANSIVQWELTSGLKYIMATVGTPGNGSLTMLDNVNGNIELKLQASESVRIPEGTYFFDVKVIENTAEVYTKARGEITFFYDITKAVS